MLQHRKIILAGEFVKGIGEHFARRLLIDTSGFETRDEGCGRGSRAGTKTINLMDFSGTEM